MEFDSIFDGQLDSETEFDTIFDREEDGNLIDLVSGVNEGTDGVCPELHQTARDATPDDIKDELGEGNDTDNAPSGAEGTDNDPVINLAAGNGGGEFSANGCKGQSDADRMYKDYDNETGKGQLPGEGPDVNPDPEDIEGEFDKMHESMSVDDLDNDYDATFGESSSSYEGYEEGDGDLVDLVSGE